MAPPRLLNSKAAVARTVAGVNQRTELEEELLIFPKSPNDETGDRTPCGYGVWAPKES
jgi:hypothetical protein